MLSDEGPASLPSVDSDGIPIDEDDEDGNEDNTVEVPVSRSSRLQQVRHISCLLGERILFFSKNCFGEKEDHYSINRLVRYRIRREIGSRVSYRMVLISLQ